MAYDQRGHGESGGPRGHSPSLEALLDDLALFLRKVEKKYPGTPIVLYGHSMGGNFPTFILVVGKNKCSFFLSHRIR